MKPPHSNRPGGSSGDRSRSDRPRNEGPRGDGPRGPGPRGDGPRGDNPRGDGPRGTGPRGDGPRGDAPRGSGPRGGAPRGEGPHGEGSRSEGPRGERPFRARSGGGDRPQGERRLEGPRGERPQGDRPYRERPQGDRPQGERRPEGPRGERPARAERPHGDRPQGERRFEGPRGEAGAHAPRREGGFDGPRRDRDSGFAGRGERGHRTSHALQEPGRGAGGIGPAPSGTVWLYGIHAVAAALANPARRLRRLLLTEEAEATLAGQLPHPWPLAAERTERPRMDQLLGNDIAHQGAALLADPLGAPPLAQVLEKPGPVVVLDQVTDPRNVGAIMRSAAAFGAAAVVVQDRNAPEETGALAKAASGALERVPLLRAVNIARTLIALKAAGLWVIGLDADATKLDGPGLADRRLCLVLGAEGEGLRRLTRETCDMVAGLAMPGGMESLNVGAAAAIALYEINRGRKPGTSI